MLEGTPNTPHTPHDTLPLRLPEQWTDGGTADDGPAPGGKEERGGAAAPHRGRRRHAAGGRGGEGGGLQRSSLLMALGTVVSRGTGLIRQVLQAAALGTGLLATTYNTANMVPMSIYT
ncbi:murein biosynthesis integral membrane protein MurJ, partial [Streptomyces decoyicus]